MQIVSQGWMCPDSCTFFLTDEEVADQTCCLTLSQYTDTVPVLDLTPLRQASGRVTK